MKRTYRKFTREFKIKVLREIENGKSQAQTCREYGLLPSMVTRWKIEYKQYPDTAFSGRGNLYKEEAKIAELERLVGRLYAENEFLKKALSVLEKRVQEEKEKAKLR